MKTGIIVYSYTGTTLKAAQQLLEAMKKKGQDAELLQIKADNQKAEMNPSLINITVSPAVDGFDHLVFAAPVWGFSLSRVMQAYLSGLPALSGKKISLFITQGLTLHWLGGSKAIKQMTDICREKGGEVIASAFIGGSQKHRESDTAKMVEAFI